MNSSLKVNIGRIELRNPVIAASGTFGDEYKDLVSIRSFGAIVTKTVTLERRLGNPPPRIAETPAGMLNSIGLENKGADDFIKNKLPKLCRYKVPIIASIAGDDDEEFEELARYLGKAETINALELNLSCPNIRYGSKDCLIAQDEFATFEVVKRVRAVTDCTIIAKLSPNVTDIRKMAMAAEDAGADSISLVNTFLGMAVDIETKRPKIGNIVGGLSGPAIMPIALRMAWEVYSCVKIPIIGMGGIMNFEDAIAFILCGASAIQVGTANFVNPMASAEILDGMKRYLGKNKISNINKLIGTLKID